MLFYSKIFVLEKVRKEFIPSSNRGANFWLSDWCRFTVVSTTWKIVVDNLGSMTTTFSSKLTFRCFIVILVLFNFGVSAYAFEEAFLFFHPLCISVDNLGRQSLWHRIADLISSCLRLRRRLSKLNLPFQWNCPRFLLHFASIPYNQSSSSSANWFLNYKYTLSTPSLPLTWRAIFQSI